MYFTQKKKYTSYIYNEKNQRFYFVSFQTMFLKLHNNEKFKTNTYRFIEFQFADAVVGNMK